MSNHEITWVEARSPISGVSVGAGAVCACGWKSEIHTEDTEHPNYQASIDRVQSAAVRDAQEHGESVLTRRQSGLLADLRANDRWFQQAGFYSTADLDVLADLALARVRVNSSGQREYRAWVLDTPTQQA